jgi:hypothetical protein
MAGRVDASVQPAHIGSAWDAMNTLYHSLGKLPEPESTHEFFCRTKSLWH